MQASAADSFLVPALTLGVLGTLGWLGRNAGPSRSGVTPSGPTIVEQSPPEDRKDAPPAEPANPREAGLSDRRRRHILDGDRKGGGHGPGRNTPGKSNFPSYLNNGKAMPADLFEVFEKLAVDMEMDGDEDYEGVAQLRVETKARLG